MLRVAVQFIIEGEVKVLNEAGISVTYTKWNGLRKWIKDSLCFAFCITRSFNVPEFLSIALAPTVSCAQDTQHDVSQMTAQSDGPSDGMGHAMPPPLYL